MSRRSLHLLLLLAVLGYTSGVALAAHRSIEHPHHAHEAGCAVCHALTTQTIDALPASASILFDTSLRFTLSPTEETATRRHDLSPAQPRAPPVG